MGEADHGSCDVCDAGVVDSGAERFDCPAENDGEGRGRYMLGRYMRVRTGSVWAAVVAAVAFGVFGAARAQDAASNAKPAMMAKDAEPDWEVVTVKFADPNATNAGFNVHGHEIAIERKTVEAMLVYGYGVHKRQLTDAPDWTRTELWNAQGLANVPGQPTHRQMQSLVRKLLEERFGLKLHREQREMPVFALTVAKSGPRMEKSTGDPNGSSNESDNENGGQVTMRVQNFSMGELTAILMGLFLDRPAVDQTRLNGRYDFQLKWTWDMTPESALDAPPGLFTAIQEQLGLKLEPVKAPVDVLVVDKVERPGAN
jgi:uncharacterized protein (TIGR03435 family)